MIYKRDLNAPSSIHSRPLTRKFLSHNFFHVFTQNRFTFVCFYFHKSAEDDSGNIDETLDGSGDEEDATKNVNNV